MALNDKLTLGTLAGLTLMLVVPAQLAVGHPYLTCNSASKAATGQCVQALQFAAAAEAGNVAQATQAVSGSTGTGNLGSTMQGATQATGAAQAAGAKSCQAAATTCLTACGPKFLKMEKTVHTTESKAAPLNMKAIWAAHTKHIGMMNANATRCKTTLASISSQLGGSAITNFISANKAALVAGAVGLGAGYLIGNSGSGDSGGSSAAPAAPGTDEETDEGSSGGVDPEDCTDTANAAAVNCREHYIDTCKENINSEGCSEFVGSYCADGNDGSGSGFCAHSQSLDYCSDGSKANSPACQWLSSMTYECTQDLGSPACLPQYDTRADAEAACADRQTDPLCNAVLNQGLLVSGPAGGLPTAQGGTASLTAASTSGFAAGTTSLASGSSTARATGSYKRSYNGSYAGSGGGYRGSSNSGYSYNKSGKVNIDFRGNRALASAKLPGDIKGGNSSSTLFNSHHEHFQTSCQANQFVGCHAQSSHSYGGGSQ